MLQEIQIQNTDKIKSYLILKNQRHLRSICRKIGISLMLLLTVAGVNAGFENKIDSLHVRLKQTLHDTDRVNTLSRLAWEISFLSADSAIALDDEALRISKTIGYKSGELQSMIQLGTYYDDKGLFTISLDYYNNVIKKTDEMLAQIYENEVTHEKRKKIMQLRASCIGNISNVYRKQGSLAKALKTGFEALKMTEELKDTAKLASKLYSISQIYVDLGNASRDTVSRNINFEKAIELLRKAQFIDEKTGFVMGVAYDLSAIANVYYYQNKNDSSIYYHLKALEIDKKINNKDGVARHLGNIGNIYSDRAEQASDESSRSSFYSKTFEYYFHSLRLREELGNKSYISIQLGNIGSVYFAMGNYSESEKYLLRALNMDIEMHRLEGIRNRNKKLSELYVKTKNFKLSFDHFKKYTEAKDSMFNEEKSKEIGRLEQQYEFAMAEIERKRVESEKLKAESEKIKRRDLLQYSAILIGIFLFFGVILLMGKFNVPVWVVEASVFMLFLLVFEFTLVLLDPTIDAWTGGAPAYKLLLNALLAGLIFPVHGLCERLLKKKIMERR